MKSKIIASGSYVPELVVSNHDFAKILDTSDEWIVQRTGIKSRHFEAKSNVHMATQAALKALESVDKASIDMIIVCTYSPDSFIPTVANLLQKELAIDAHIPCFDLNAACTGFLYGLQVADAFLQAKMYRRILLLGSDRTSQTLDFTDRSTAILFGDGAGAVVLELGDHGIIQTNLYGQDDREGSITLNNIQKSENPFIEKQKSKVVSLFDMKGADVFRFAIKAFTKSVKDVLKDNGLSVADVDYIISHQANERIIETAARMLKMDMSQFPMNLAEYGNTSAASIPMVLDALIRENKLKSGMKVVLVAFGGGLTYGASLIEW